MFTSKESSAETKNRNMLISISVNYNEIMSHLNTPVRSEVATSITGPPTSVPNVRYLVSKLGHVAL